MEAQQQRVPFAYLTARVALPDGWDRIPAAYLAFGETYADELADARSRGWPAHVMAGRHLHMVVAPRAVAAQIMRLASQWWRVPKVASDRQGQRIKTGRCGALLSYHYSGKVLSRARMARVR